MFKYSRQAGPLRPARGGAQPRRAGPHAGGGYNNNSSGRRNRLSCRRKAMAEWWQSSAKWICKAERLSLRASLLPKAFLQNESLWDDFCTLRGWVCLSCLVAPGRGLRRRPKPSVEHVVSGIRTQRPCGVGWGNGAPRTVRSKSLHAHKTCNYYIPRIYTVDSIVCNFEAFNRNWSLKQSLSLLFMGHWKIRVTES